MMVIIDKSDIVLANHRNTLFLGGLIVGKISYSESIRSHFLNMKNISDIVYEGKSILDCEERAIEEVVIFLNDILKPD